MPAKRRRPSPRTKTPQTIPCTIHVQRGGVQISVEHIMLAQAADVACYLLAQLEAKRDAHPELSRPHEVTQIGGYTVVSTDDDGTWAKRQPPRVGF